MNIEKIRRILKNPRYIYHHIKTKGKFDDLSDAEYMKLQFKYIMGYELNLSNTETYNEKLQWLKLYDRNPEYTDMVDKYKVRDVVADRIGEEYLIPLLGVWDSFEDIDFEKLPNEFVLKPNHTSGDVYICNNKSDINFNELQETINRWLKREYFWGSREWPYKNVKPRIIAEKFMVDNETNELRDYKFFCFDGKTKLMFVATERNEHNTKFNFYDTDFNLLPMQQGYPNTDKKIEKPKNFEKMIKLAEELSVNIPHVRVDFYEHNGNIYFGEMTFYHFSGLVKINPKKYDYLLGSWINLPK